MVSFKQLITPFIVVVFCGIVQAKQVRSVLDSDVKVYKRPHIRSKVVNVLQKGEKILILKSHSKKFYRVKLKNGKKGYVSKKSLRSDVGKQQKKRKESSHAFSLSLLGMYSYQGQKEVVTSSGSNYTVDPSVSLSFYPEVGYYYLANRFKWKLGLYYKVFEFEQIARNSDSGGALGETVSEVKQTFLGAQLSVGLKSKSFLWLIGGEAMKALSSDINIVKGVAIEEDDSSMPLFLGGFLQCEYNLGDQFLTLLKIGTIFNTNPFIYNFDIGLGYRF